MVNYIEQSELSNTGFLFRRTTIFNWFKIQSQLLLIKLVKSYLLTELFNLDKPSNAPSVNIVRF
jgi:hypothetical protein